MGSKDELQLDPFDAVVEDVRAGKQIIIVDDASRENEGDLTLAAEKITPEHLSFMANYGKGLICLSLEKTRCDKLGFAPQTLNNTSSFGTNFTISIDHKSVAAEGVTAEGRARTILEAASDSAKAQDFISPGYIFPLSAVPGGVLKRRGQTEASVDIARIAGLAPAGVICEIMDSTGKMLRGDALQKYARDHKLRITSVEEILQHRLKTEVSLRRVAESEAMSLAALGLELSADLLKKYQGQEILKLYAYIDDVDSKEHLAIVVGAPTEGSLLRLHSECLTGDVFSSVRCDCGYQLQTALVEIIKEGSGIIVYLNQEGRGIGLANKLRAYELQDLGRDTVDANLELGFKIDERDYRAGAQIVSDLGLTTIRLMTNNPDKVYELKQHGINVLERIGIESPVCEHNAKYLEAKRDKLGHFIASSN